MLGYDLQKPPAGYFRLAAGQHFTISKDVAVGQGYYDLMAAFREIDGVPSGTLQGQVVAAGTGVNDVRVAAIDVEGKLATDGTKISTSASMTNAVVSRSSLVDRPKRNPDRLWPGPDSSACPMSSWFFEPLPKKATW
jgi:hypothetical protein